MTKHTPSLEEVRDATSLFRSRFFDQDEFDRWYQAEVAAAEQRGKAEGWDEAMTTQIQRLISSDPDVERFHMPANPYRADRLEGDDE